MGSWKRIVVLVADGFGVGAAPDAGEYGDEGANTFLHTAESVGGLRLPHLEKLGLGNLGPVPGVRAVEPLALVGKLREKSVGKDTTTGHWELAGLVTREPLPLFPQGFPAELVDRFIREAEIPGVLANTAASGTEIIQQWGEEHVRSGKPILYTSGDSVFQVACHEESFGLERLYQICKIAREMTLKLKIGRVIARPFVGDAVTGFRRTENRRDYSLEPPRNTLDLLKENGVEVLSVGKIDDIFAGRGITRSRHTGNNRDGLKATMDALRESRGRRALIFVNLVDFDMLYGHRRDPVGYAKALVELDAALSDILAELTSEDCLMLTADHGCDPCFRGTDHTREYVPLVCYSPSIRGANIGERSAFSEVGASLLKAFGVAFPEFIQGTPSFLPEQPVIQ